MTDALGNLMRAAASTVSNVGRAVGRAADEFVNDTAEDIRSVGQSAERDGLAAGLITALNVTSPGNTLANGLDALGIIPDNDPVMKNIVSAATNGVLLNPAAFIDAVDLAKAVATPAPTKADNKPIMAASHSIAKPHKPQHGDAPKWADAHQASSSSSPSSSADAMAQATEALVAELTRLVESGRVCHVSDASKPTVCVRAPDDLRNRGEFPAATRDIFENPHRSGPSVLGRPLEDVSVADIVNDKSLCFEDMLFLVMLKCSQDMQKEMEAQLQELDAINNALDSKEGQGKSTSTSKSGATAGAPQQGGKPATQDAGGFLDQLFSPDNMKAFAAGTLDLVGAIGPIVGPMIGGAIGAVAIPGIGAVPGAVIGEALGAGAPVIAGMLSTAVKDGAFDGLFEGKAQLDQAKSGAAGAAATGGSPVTGSAQSGKGDALAGKSEDALRRSRDQIMEKVKLLSNKLSEMQQTLSNLMNTQHETAMNAIRNIK